MIQSHTDSSDDFTTRKDELGISEANISTGVAALDIGLVWI